MEFIQDYENYLKLIQQVAIKKIATFSIFDKLLIVIIFVWKKVVDNFFNGIN